MAVKVDYDTDKRIIYVTLAPTDGVVNLDVQTDLYSDIKEDWRSNATLNKFMMPISSVGGNPLPGSKTLGDTYFLETPWKIRPYEADHKLAINGNLFARDGSSVMVPTIGNYNVLVEMFVSNLSDSSIQQLSEIQYSVYQGGVWIAALTGESGTEYPTGTPFTPVDNITDALSIRSNQSLPKKLWILEDLTLDATATLVNYILEGLNHIQTKLTIQAAANVQGITLRELEIEGTLDGETIAAYCIISDLTYLNGHIHNCALNGKLTLGGGIDAFIKYCSQMDFNNVPEVDMGGSGQDLVMIGYTGQLYISNLTGASSVGIGLDAGQVILKSSVTAGIVHVSGDGKLIDEAGDDIPTGTWNGGVTVYNETTSSEHTAQHVWNALVVDHTNTGSFGEQAEDTLKKAKLAAFKL